jgi:uncharacterized protein YtpQ (UPF0354 family)
MFGLFGKKTAPFTEPVVPRIKHLNFIEALKPIAAKDPGAMPVTEPLVGDLIVTYAIDMPGMFKMFSQREFEKSGLSKQELRATAVANLRKNLPRLKLSTKGPLVSLALGSNLDACLLVIDRIWEQVIPHMPVPGKIVATAPNRDMVLCTSSESEEGIAKLRQIAKVQHAKEPVHSLSEQLMLREGGEWFVFQGNGEGA